MRITDLLKESSIKLNAAASSKDEVIDQVVNLMASAGVLADKSIYKKAVLAREASGSTGIGEGIAIPHAKTSAVKEPALAAMVLPQGTEFDSLDGEPVKLVFLIAAPDTEDNIHLDVLSRLSVLLMDDDFRANLLASKSPKEFLQVIDRTEREKEAAEEQKEASIQKELPQKGTSHRILAVTACPTGIAHTYMAAEAIEKAGNSLGISVKVETNGSGGAKNLLTASEIAAADGIIVAADTNVNMQRFHGKPVVKAKVADGIHHPEKLIKDITEGRAVIYQDMGGKAEEQSEGQESLGRQVYKHLMNGVSHMLPFVIGGGILIALAFLFDSGAVNDTNFGSFGSITPLAAFFNSVGGVAFGFMLPILAGYIAMSIADRPGLAIGFVGGALAVSGATFASPGGTDVSAGFLGALIAGFVGGYLVLALRKACDKLPAALEGIKPVLIYPLVGILMIGIVMCAINPFVGMLNSAIFSGLESMGGSSKILLGLVLAAMMAIDMGGPFNKAAYVFGTATLTAATGGSDVMAAVMIGGMVPPLAIALATSFFKNRFTEDERKSGPVNYIMGLCFITEGAIPFAASDPLHVLPSCIVGSGIAGALSMAFQCTLPAPHGGMFVFPVMSNVLFYIAALVIGSVAGMFMLALLKKPVAEHK